ncbi:hypothetical protein LCGC14_0572270 [marine sediment metagenome]|uniref:Mu-like prophage protein Com n=1 Tax=marine sediment metagenome TaxID=412755 RepID=A0A0F9RP09_9ZZZZ
MKRGIQGLIFEIRCKKCNKKLGGNLDGKVEIVCPRCGHYNAFNIKVKSVV